MHNRENWKESENNNDWDIIWVDKPWITINFDIMRFNDFQKINHFRNFYELTRKDLLIKNVNKLKIQFRKTGEVFFNINSFIIERKI